MPAHPVFVTRKFPPSVGGMETLAASVWRSLLTVRPDAVKLSHGGGNKALVWWLPLSVLRLAVLVGRGQVEVVLTGDALTHAVVAPLLRALRVPHATMVMGLDVTYPNPVYRSVVHRQLRRAPRVLAISAATAAKAQAAGVAPERAAVLRLGVQEPPVGARDRAAARTAVLQRLGLTPDRVLVLTLGRLVPRKGARWFVSHVLPGLPPDLHYLLAGEGPEAVGIAKAASQAGVANRVHLLGAVDEQGREDLMRGADLFVQPNVPVAGDLEGFGLVVVEAALRGTPVVAADLEGIRDAVVDGRTGLLLPSGDAAAWQARLTDLLADRPALARLGEGFRSEAAALYGEDAMGRSLAGLLGLADRG